MLEQLPKRVLTVADTMDLWINTAKDGLLSLLKQIDGLVLNYDEAELLTGKANSVTAGRHILDMGPKFVVVKKGEHGAILIHKQGVAALPAYPTENVWMIFDQTTKDNTVLLPSILPGSDAPPFETNAWLA